MTLEEIRSLYRQQTGYGDRLATEMRAARCKTLAYYMGKGGMSDMEYRIANNVPASMYYR